MCTGMHHCGACEERAAGKDVHDFIEGHTHVMPQINDGALMWATKLRREAYFNSLMVNQDLHALDFPEFRNARSAGKYRDDIITRMWANFDRLMALLPEFAAEAATNPFRQPSKLGGCASRKQRIHARMLWKRQVIQRFAETPDGFDKMLAAVGWNKPWWLQVTQSTDPQQAVAA